MGRMKFGRYSNPVSSAAPAPARRARTWFFVPPPGAQTASPLVPPGVSYLFASQPAPVIVPSPTTTGAGERGPLQFASGERIAALALGALVWFLLALSNRSQNGALGFVPLFDRSAEAGTLFVRLVCDAARGGYSGPLAFCASLGAAFLVREAGRVPVRGLERAACFVLSLPLFQVFAVALIAVSDRFALPVPAAVGGVLLLGTGLVSVLGGVYVLLSACANGRGERLAFIAVPLLWAWQLFCFIPWSYHWSCGLLPAM